MSNNPVKRLLGENYRERWSKASSVNAVMGALIGRDDADTVDNLRAALGRLPHSLLQQVYTGMFGTDPDATMEYDYEPDDGWPPR